jgi:hypothetical protein
MRGPRVLLRLAVIVSILCVHGARTAATASVALVAGGRAYARCARYRGIVRGLEALGPTFIKFGQLAGTRRDTMPTALCDELSTLHDAVTPTPPPSRAAQLELDVGQVGGKLLRGVDRSGDLDLGQAAGVAHHDGHGVVGRERSGRPQQPVLDRAGGGKRLPRLER